MSLLSVVLLLVAQAAPDPLSFKLSDAEITDPSRTIKTRIAVMALGTAGAPADYADGLTETIATTTQETGVFEVVSPRQIASLLAYEKRKELLGGCVEEACYVQIAQTVRAEHLVAGSVAKVGDKLVLNLVLIDAAEGKALKRTNRETKTATDLLREARDAVIVLLQPVLSARQGYLKVAANVPDAQLVVDDELRSEGVGQVVRLAAGPHLLKVKREGFYTATADVFVRPGRVGVEDVKLIPAKETIEGYESSASLMRYGAYATAVVAVGAGGGPRATFTVRPPTTRTPSTPTQRPSTASGIPVATPRSPRPRTTSAPTKPSICRSSGPRWSRVGSLWCCFWSVTTRIATKSSAA
jgi:TolB-like protein